MASLLDYLGLGATATARQGTARMEGEQVRKAGEERDLLARLQQQRQAAQDARQAQMDDLNRRNIESQMRDREAPPAPAAPRRQIVDGQIVDLDAGSARPIEGYTAPAKQAPTPAAGSFAPFTDPEGRPVFFNPQTGATVRAPEGFKPPNTRAGLPTEAERKAAAFYASGKKGYETLEAMLGDDPSTPEVEKGKPVPGWFAQQAAKVGLGAGNVMTNAQMRQMRQSALMLSDAWLRYTSGAAVPEQEVERFAESFIPRAGDDPTTLQQKKEARATIIEALRKGAGRALDPALSGTQPTAADVPDLDAEIDALLGRRP
jgi:hypothetical protein